MTQQGRRLRPTRKGGERNSSGAVLGAEDRTAADGQTKAEGQRPCGMEAVVERALTGSAFCFLANRAAALGEIGRSLLGILCSKGGGAGRGCISTLFDSARPDENSAGASIQRKTGLDACGNSLLAGHHVGTDCRLGSNGTFKCCQFTCSHLLSSFAIFRIFLNIVSYFLFFWHFCFSKCRRMP